MSQKKQITRPRKTLKQLENQITKDDIDYGVSDDEVDEDDEDVDVDVDELNIDEESTDEESTDKSKDKKTKKSTKNPTKKITVEKINSEELPPLVSSKKERYEYKPIISNTSVIIHNSNRITPDCMSKFEFAEVISIRAVQIEKGGVCYTDVSALDDPREKARQEIIDKKCPLSICRMLKEGVYEKFSVNELAIPIGM